MKDGLLGADGLLDWLAGVGSTWPALSAMSDEGEQQRLGGLLSLIGWAVEWFGAEHTILAWVDDWVDDLASDWPAVPCHTRHHTSAVRSFRLPFNGYATPIDRLDS